MHTLFSRFISRCISRFISRFTCFLFSPFRICNLGFSLILEKLQSWLKWNFDQWIHVFGPIYHSKINSIGSFLCKLLAILIFSLFLHFKENYQTNRLETHLKGIFNSDGVLIRFWSRFVLDWLSNWCLHFTLFHSQYEEKYWANSNENWIEHFV